MDAPAHSLEPYSVRCVQGRSAVLRALPELEQAASLWGQRALVGELPFYASMPGKVPVLLLLCEDGSPGLRGAVFLYAFGHAVFGTRLLSNADRFGRIGVFGPAGRRAHLAVAATRYLLQAGSTVVRLTFDGEADLLLKQGMQEPVPEQDPPQANRPAETWEQWSHDLFFSLTLHPDLDNTLAPLGRRTRRNVREVMRRCVLDLQCSFVAEAPVTLEEFLRLNRQSARPVSARVARWQYHQAHASTAFFCGIQAGDGQWLALAGGRRAGETLIVDWQRNDLAFARYSPSLLMRGFLMQHFGQEGMQLLHFEGGTSHRMAGHFNKRTVHFLRASRQALWLDVLRTLMLRWLPAAGMTKFLFGHG